MSRADGQMKCVRHQNRCRGDQLRRGTLSVSQMRFANRINKYHISYIVGGRQYAILCIDLYS